MYLYIYLHCKYRKFCIILLILVENMLVAGCVDGWLVGWMDGYW